MPSRRRLPKKCPLKRDVDEHTNEVCNCKTPPLARESNLRAGSSPVHCGNVLTVRLRLYRVSSASTWSPLRTDSRQSSRASQPRANAITARKEGAAHRVRASASALGVSSCWSANELPTPIGWRVSGQNSYRLHVPISARTSCSALLINGTVGAGKISVAEMVGDLLTEAGVPNAVIDLDWLRRSWPSPEGDRFNVAVALRNLRSVARNYRDAGAVRIVLAGVIETRVDRDRHEDALGIPLAVCRLCVDLPPPEVLMDPQRSFGQPSVRGVRTDVLAEDYRAGESLESLADLYDLELTQVDQAIRFELITSAAKAS